MLTLHVVSSRNIFEKVCQKLSEMNIKAKEKVVSFFQNYEGPFKEEILKNFEIAANQQLPLCQDTGIVEFFVWKGCMIFTEKPINDILYDAVKYTYTKMGFRKSVVVDPLFSRKNTQDNTPPIVHIFETEEPILDIWIIVKGGGSENLSALFMLQPSEGYDSASRRVVEHIKENGRNACPPIKIGIGIGGTADEAILISKLALFDEDVRKYNRHILRYFDVENDLKEQLTKLKIGVQGLGFGEGIHDIKVYGAPTHIASLPVAISVDCYLLRSGMVVIDIDR